MRRTMRLAGVGTALLLCATIVVFLDNRSQRAAAGRSIAAATRIDPLTRFDTVFSGEDSAATRIGAQFRDPAYHDEQQLRRKCAFCFSDEYHTGVIKLRAEPAPTDYSQFSNWTTVATLSVPPETKFSDWKIDTPASASFVVYDVQLKTVAGSNPASPKYEARIALGGSEKQTLDVAYLPENNTVKTAHFLWNVRNISRDRQAISVSCPSGRCIIVEAARLSDWMDGATAKKACTSNSNADCVSIAVGSHDEQRLAEMAGGQLKRSKVHGVLVPSTLLDSYTKFDDFDGGAWKPVATARVTGGDYEKPAFTFPENTQVSISLRRVGSVWEARLFANGQEAIIPVPTPHDHGMLPPASVRWKWNALDEGIWVRCGPGCCKVDPI